MLDAKSEIDAALREYEIRIHEDAEADKLAKLTHASAYLASSGTAGERNAYADKGCVDERYRARLADGLKRSAALCRRCEEAVALGAPESRRGRASRGRSWRSGSRGRSRRDALIE